MKVITKDYLVEQFKNFFDKKIKPIKNDGVPVGASFKFEGETIPDGYIEEDELKASEITYDNATSGLESTNVQSATDELSQNLTELGKVHKTLLTISNKSTKGLLVRQGNFVYFNSVEDASSVASGTVTVATIPVGYRPTKTIRLPISNTTLNAFITINALGTVSEYSQSASTSTRNDAYFGIWYTEDEIPS